MSNRDRDARPTGKRRIAKPKQQDSSQRPLPRRPLIPSELDANDPEYVKNRIALEMFRSISVGKIIAVIGSGVTVPYGYDSWSALCDNLIGFITELYNRQTGVRNANGGKKYLTEAGLRLYRRYDAVAPLANLGDEEKRAVCDAMFVHLTDDGKTLLHEKYSEWFGLRSRIKRKKGQIESLLGLKGRAADQTRAHFGKDAYLPPDLGRVLELFRDEVGSGRATADGIKFEKKLLDAPLQRMSSSRNSVDPLKALRAELRINRFATFNYDLEIEAMLEDLDYPYNELTGVDGEAVHDTQSRLGSSARSISLSPLNTSELIALAAMPSSDDAMIVHMHGSVAKPEDMVVTHREYNALYIDDYPGHKSFDDARKLMFGGNAILYVGVGLSEEDLMRPLRYLASALPDRPIYALIPSLSSVSEDLALIQRIKVSYGVNVIPYGWDHTTIGDSWPIDPPEHELGKEFNALHTELRNIRAGLKRLLRGEPIDIEATFSKSETPRLHSHHALAFVLKRLQVALHGARRESPTSRTLHLRRTLHAAFVATVEAIAEEDAFKTKSLRGDRPFAEEKSLISATLGKRFRSIREIREALDPKNAPRLNRNPQYQAICGLSDKYNGRRPVNEDAFVRFFESLIIGTALVHVLKYLAGATSIWRKRWRVFPAPHLYADWQPRVLHSTGIDVSRLDPDEVDLAREIYESVVLKSREPFMVLHFDSKSRKGAFLSYVESARSGKRNGTSRDDRICIYCLDHVIAPNSLLPSIFRYGGSPADSANDEAGSRLVFVRNAERLLDAKLTHTQNLMVERMLNSARGSNDRYVFITGKSRAADFFSKYFGVEKETLSLKTSKKRIRPKTEERTIEKMRGQHLWTGRVYAGIEAGIPANRREEFLRLCDRILESRLANSDPKYGRSSFCGAILDARHLWVREHGANEDKTRVVLEHAILKWMFTIHIPMSVETLMPLKEIQEIDTAYPRRKSLPSMIASALSNLENCGFVYRIKNDYGRSAARRAESGNDESRLPRYILHKQVRMYLAHKRGLSYGWMDHREWNTATVCNAIAEGGPLFNRKDYLDACAQFNAYIDNFHQCGFAGDDEGFPARSSLNCAYALVRGHLYAHNAIRAGMAFLPERHALSVLDDHVSRLARLRSSSMLLKRNGSARWLPPFYESFDMWILNEIAVIRYMQGDFHDCVMLFREALEFCERKTSGCALEHDPTLTPRIKINLALSLVERARFEEALQLIESANSELEEARTDSKPVPTQENERMLDAAAKIASGERPQGMEPHPEYLLLRAVAYGCRAQIELLMAKLDRARDSIRESLEKIDKVDVLGVRGWLHSIEVLISSATGDLGSARTSLVKALAAARGSLRPDLIMNLEIAQAEFQMRDAAGDRRIAIATLSNLNEIEKSARRIGSRKAQVSIMLIRARILLYLEQVDSARDATLDAICQSLLNGMRLKRITGLILMSAIMAMRGETHAAKNLLYAVRLTAMKMRYIRAVLDIDRLERAIDIDGGVAQWAGFIPEYDASDERRHGEQ